MKDLIVTKKDLSDGITIKVIKNQIVRVQNWTNKNGSNILFKAPVTGIYKLKGNING